MQEDISYWTDKYLTIPYKVRGRDRKEGVDCWGLICLIFKEEFNLELDARKIHRRSEEFEELKPTFLREVSEPHKHCVGLACNELGLHAVFFIKDKEIIEAGTFGVQVTDSDKYKNQYIRYYEICDV